MSRDLRNAVRTLAATPVVTIAAVLSLALGIGANTAIFSIVDSLLIRSLPVEAPDRLALVKRDRSRTFSSWTYPIWEQIRDRQGQFARQAFAFRSERVNIAERGQTEYVEGLWGSGAMFEALGVPAALGRTFTPADDVRGGGPDGPVAVLSYACWQRRFGGDAGVIGRRLTIERVAFTIIGVTPPGFFGPDVGRAFDVAIPLGTEPLVRGRDSALDRRGTWWLSIMARLKDGQSLAAAEQALRGVQPQIRAATIPEHYRPQDRARYLTEPLVLTSGASGVSMLRLRYQRPVLLLMAVVALVLLIACANIANLLLARAAARRHEFSVRIALGASRWRLARQVLAESLLLSGLGALAGLVVAHWGSRLLMRQLSTHADLVFLDLALDWRMLGFTVAVAGGTALLFGLAPALAASRSAPIDAIREHGRGGAGERRLGLGSLLVAGQVALSLVLIVAASLFTRTFASLATLDPGFDRDPVLVVRVNAQKSQAAPEARAALYARAVEAVRALPGVAHASASMVTPVSGSTWSTLVEVKDGPDLEEPAREAYVNQVTADWFETYGTRLVAGRDFDGRDGAAGTPVAIVNETFARRFLSGGSPVGRLVRASGAREDTPWLEVIGVAQDAVYRSLRDPVPPTLYRPLTQIEAPISTVSLSVRAAGGAPALLMRGVTTALARVDRDLALTFVPLRQQIDGALAQERLVAMLSMFFGLLALLLAGLGLYGVTAYSVHRRRAELGIRLALGASPATVVGLVLRRVGLLVALGVAAGAAAAAWASRFVETLLFGLPPRDVATFLTAALLLAGVGALAGYVPARRASRIDPMQVLRQD